jgi:hypothetical protein
MSGEAWRVIIELLIIYYWLLPLPRSGSHKKSPWGEVCLNGKVKNIILTHQITAPEKVFFHIAHGIAAV